MKRQSDTTGFRERAISQAQRACGEVKAQHAGRLDSLIADIETAVKRRDWSAAHEACHAVAGEAAWLDAPLAGALAYETTRILDAEHQRNEAAVETAAQAIALAARGRMDMNDPEGAQLRDQLIEMRAWATE